MIAPIKTFFANSRAYSIRNILKLSIALAFLTCICATITSAQFYVYPYYHYEGKVYATQGTDAGPNTIIWIDTALVTYDSNGIPVSREVTGIQFGLADGNSNYSLNVTCIAGEDTEFVAESHNMGVIRPDGTFYTSGFQTISDIGCRFPPNNPQHIYANGLALKGVAGAGGTPSYQSVGCPVNTTNGNVWLNQRDYFLPGVNEALQIKRTYNSIVQTPGLFGTGWNSNFDESLSIPGSGNGLIIYHQDNGGSAYFSDIGNNNIYTATLDFYGNLVKNTDNTFTLTFKDGRVHKFRSDGKLLWQKDVNGNQTTLSYNTSSQLTGVTDPFNRTLTIATGTNGAISSISDSTGTIATYEYYTGTTNLKTVTYPDGSKYQFEYTTISGNLYLQTIKDALNNILETHEYDSLGRATTSEKDGGVEKFTLDYSHSNETPPNDSYTTVTDAEGHVTKYYYTLRNDHNVISMIEGSCNCGGSAPERTVFEYDYQGNITRIFDSLFHFTTYTYNSTGNILTSTDNNSGVETFTYNALGKVLTYTDQMNGTTTNVYDSHGNLLTSTDPLSNTTTYTYTSLGQPKTLTNARNKTTTLNYDSSGRVTEYEDANNKSTTFGYDARARVTSTTDAVNNTTEFEYDAAGRIKKINYPDTTFIEYTYDTAGRVTNFQDGRGKITAFGYDDAYRLTSVTDPLNHTVTYGYDDDSLLISSTNAVGKTTDYEYNTFHRLKKVTYPAPTSSATRLFESFTYDGNGNLDTHTDTAGRVTDYDYDNIDRLVKVTDALNKELNFEYNARSQAIKVIDALDQEYNFTYDPFDRVLTQNRAGSTMTYQYDVVGNRTRRMDHNGVETIYTYDNVDRLTDVTYPASAVAYEYDDISRLTSATNAAGTVTFAYDNRNRLTSTTDVFNHTLDFDYDENGNRTELRLDSTALTQYYYDDANRLSVLRDEEKGNFNYTYDNANRLLSMMRPNNIETTYTYDDMDRLTRLKHKLSAATLFDNVYSYNTASRISQIADLSQTRVFSYDAVDRLTGVSVSSSSVENYDYDEVGNRTDSHLNTFHNYGVFNRLTGTNLFDYTYNDNGGLIGRSDYQAPPAVGVPNHYDYGWDEEDRLVSAYKNAESQGLDPTDDALMYEYDALGRRVKRIGAAETHFTYDGLDVVMDDDSAAGTTFYQNGLGIDNKLKLENGSGDSFFLQDHLGSTVGLADDSGSVTDSNTYDSFGNPGNANFPTRYQFTGRELEKAGGLYYYRERWYDPGVGRFISEDPVGFSGGVNWYEYVGNNPQNFVDPEGLSPIIKLVKFVTKNGKQMLIETGKKLTLKQAQNVRRNGGSIMSKGRNSQNLSTRVESGAFKNDRSAGDMLRHPPHEEGFYPHYQTQGKNGHSFYRSAASIFAPNIMGTSDSPCTTNAQFGSAVLWDTVSLLDPVGLTDAIDAVSGLDNGRGGWRGLLDFGIDNSLLLSPFGFLKDLY